MVALPNRPLRSLQPIVANKTPDRRLRASKSLEYHCRVYQSDKFYLAWSQDHHEALKITEEAVWHGGLFALAMRRGGGKSALVVAAAAWARLNAYRRFVVIIGSDEGHATNLMKSDKSALECNQLLLEDYPEVCYPIRRLEGIAQRAGAQTYLGKRTYIGWKENEIVFPTIPGSVSSAAIVMTAGITGSIRGMQFQRSDGQQVRPDLVIPDDPQTDESAKSPQQVRDRIGIIDGTILGLAGPGEEITVLMPCTVMESNDLSDQYTDRNIRPEWQGKRFKMVNGWPTHMDLWDQYKRIRDESFRAGSGTTAATEFYRANQAAMDEGIAACWPVCKKPDELSAIQHAMNWYFKVGKKAFFAEYQNEPTKRDAESFQISKPNDIRLKANGLPRGIVPREANWLVSFIDVQKEVLLYGLLAVQKDFTGHIVDYGAYPDQGVPHFTKATLRKTLMQVEHAQRKEEAIRKGLDSLASLILPREYKSESGGIVKISRNLVDAQYEPEVVKQFCRQSPYSSILTPRFGVGIQAKHRPFNDRPPKPSEIVGLHWRQPEPKPSEVRVLRYDTNWWKTFFHQRLNQALRTSGSFTIFGEADEHEMLIEQLLAEYPTETFGHGRKVCEWQELPARTDNDCLDIFVGCCVAASMCGATLAELAEAKTEPPKTVKMSELQKTSKLYQPGNNHFRSR